MTGAANAAGDRLPEPPPAAQPAPRTERALLLLALTLSAIVYVPVTRSFFIGDDFLHLYNLVNESPLQFLLTMHGGHLLMTRNAVFLLCYTLFGTAVAAYFWTAVATHLVNVWLLFRIIRMWTDSPHLACFGAALWGTMPAHEGVLGWYSVYGHALATTCTLWVVLGLARLERGEPISRFAPIAWVLALMAAATSFGTGIGVVGVMPVVAFLLLPASPLRTRVVLLFAALALALRLLYFAVERLAIALYGGGPSMIFGLSYWRTHVANTLPLVACGILALLEGPFGQALDYSTPAGLAAVGLYLVVLLAVLIGASSTVRRRIAASLAIAIAAYAVVAIGRWMLAREQWFGCVPRYHYLSSAALTLVTCLMLSEIGRRWRAAARARTALLLSWAAATLFVHFTFARPIDHYDDARRETDWMLSQIDGAIRATPPGQDLYIENRAFRSVGGGYINRKELFPGWAAVFAIYFPADIVDGKRIRFVETDALAVTAARQGRRTADLLVSPADAPPTVFRPARQPMR